MQTVSVIIPAYNSESYIGEAIGSALAQTYPVSEIIVVDDGSTDKTKDVVLGSRAEVKYIYQENKGPAAARNRGIKEAGGDFIAFLDSDDAWLPDKVGMQLEFINSDRSLGLVCTDRIRYGGGKGERAWKREKKLYRKYNYLDLWRYPNFIVTSSALVRKECFEVCGLFDESGNISGAEDWDIWLRIAEKYDIGLLNAPLTKYRVRINGHCRSDIRRAYESGFSVIRKHEGALRLRCSRHDVLLDDKLFRQHFAYGKTLFCEGIRGDARYQFKRAISYQHFCLGAWLDVFKTYLPDTVIRKIRGSRRLTEKFSKYLVPRA